MTRSPPGHPGKESAPAVQWIRIGPDQAGQRLDNFLLTTLRGVPRSHVYQILRTGQVRVNGGRMRADYRLREADRVRLPPLRRPTMPTSLALPAGLSRELAGRFLHEDAALMVVDKPAGVAVHGGSGLSLGLIEALRLLRPRDTALELVHRLDRETSGCLLVAKRRSALRELHRQIRNGEMRKRYLALVVGDWGPQAREIDAPLDRRVKQGGERMVRVSISGKPAVTRFRPLVRYGDYSLMEVDLVTGRTHQIRVHALHAGHPVAGDEKYGDREANRELRQLGLRRLFLHSHVLVYRDPSSGQRVELEAPLGEELCRVLEELQRRTEKPQEGTGANVDREPSGVVGR